MEKKNLENKKMFLIGFRFEMTLEIDWEKLMQFKSLSGRNGDFL